MYSPSLTNQYKSLLRVSRVTCFKPSTARLSLSSARISSRATTSTTSLRPSVGTHFNLTRRAFSSTPTVRFTPSSTMSEGKVVKIETEQEFREKVLEASGPVVLDCFAEWCGPCKAIAPKLAQFSEQYPSAKFYKIDVDQLEKVAAELGVRAMPTFMLFKDGKKVSDVVGANPPALEAGIKSLIA
ncbi:thioredoxin [Aspergillus bombycis]|uniref:Thioredoxin n=1 Tax=Aspergillus bombycis TaxID=109264 RepID=A0A1F7ZL24_9EURO|nr:thioredoxin [Aspergillus bombycis]OGM40167.1 thioredoxin [Aspergillus bombycis]